MNHNRILSSVAISFLAVSVHATNSQPNLSGPAFQSLNALAESSPESAAAAMEGSLPRREGNLPIIKEAPNWQRIDPAYSTPVCEYRTVPPPYRGGYRGRPASHRGGYPRDGRYHDGHYQERHCYTVHHPAVLHRGTWQLVEIADRKGYKQEMTKKGAFWGGVVGAAALVLLALTGPIGVAVAVGLGIAAAGTAIGYGYAAVQSKTFTRIDGETSTPLP